jgi:iron complex transport system ATP-binding protein
MAAPTLEARDLAYRAAGTTLVSDISLQLHPGEVLAVVGPNGAGKTTLLHLLSGDLAPSRGVVLLDGAPLAQLAAAAQALRRAVLRQQMSMAFPFTALEVVLMGRYPYLRGRSEGPQDTAIARQSLERTEALPFAARTFPTLSGGEQTRVTLARVLAQTTPILLLDEPTAALDLRHQHATLQLARELAVAGGSVLAILHDLNLAASYADRIGILDRGSLVALGTPWEVLRADMLSQVYGVPVAVQPHPYLTAPLVLVMPDNRPSPNIRLHEGTRL